MAIRGQVGQWAVTLDVPLRVHFLEDGDLPKISRICHIYPGIINLAKWLLLPTGDEVHALYDICYPTSILH